MIIEATKPEVAKEIMSGTPEASSAIATPTPAIDFIATRVAKYKEGAFNYQMRRHPDWRENYSLYRDKVITNRLTQRQSVNVPLMKESIRTLLAKTDEFPDLYFESLGGDKQKELFLNEYWSWWVIEDRFEVKDIADKKQVGLYGRSIMKLNLFDGRPTAEVLEPYDWLCDRYADPSDIDNTANYQAHINIFRSISSLESNPLYDKQAIQRLKTFYAQALGIVKAEENAKMMQAKNERMQDMGVWDIESPAVGETYVGLTEHYIKLWDEKMNMLRIWVRVTADNEVLLHKPLDEIFGINFFPFTTWASDIEKTDLWSDGEGDIIRTPNKVLNAWFSQMVENRTLKNYGMHFYDGTAGEGKWIPQTYEPVPWGWYPTAGDPNKTTKQVEIPDLADSLNEMNFIIGMVERATATNSTEKGAPTKGNPTLGEIQLIVANSNQRITSTAKFYKIARREFGEKWYKFLMANERWIKPVKIYKKSFKGNYFEQEVKPDDWKHEAGYTCKVVSSAERADKTIQSVQKLKVISDLFPQNVPLKKILKKKALDLVDDLSPEEIKEVLDFDEMAGNTANMGGGAGDPNAPIPTPTPDASNPQATPPVMAQ